MKARHAGCVIVMAALVLLANCAGGSPESSLQWSNQVSGSGTALVLTEGGGRPLLRIACVRDPSRMVIMAESFRPIESEERLSFGVDDEPFVFVAEPAKHPSGVEATSPIHGDLLARLEGAQQVSAVYGAQDLGPYPPPDRDTTARFVGACREIAAR